MEVIGKFEQHNTAFQALLRLRAKGFEESYIPAGTSGLIVIHCESADSVQARQIIESAGGKVIN